VKLAWRIVVLGALVALPACSGSNSAGGATRTVLTDFNYDEFATSYLGFFPRVVTVHPGDTIDFKQAWTGEPHTVTMGTLAEPIGKLIEPYANGSKPVPHEEPPEFADAFKDFPPFFGDNGSIMQSGAQPCYLETEKPPQADTPCTPTQQKQPPFNGRQTFYNSGFIPYEGNNGNHFTVRLAADIKPADYFYFCLIHGPPMGGYVRVKPAGTAIPSAGTTAHDARKELDAATKSVLAGRRSAMAAKEPGVDVGTGATVDIAGGLPISFPLEFYPATVHAKVGTKVTWSLGGDDHTVAFRVPKYGPQYLIDRAGRVSLNAEAYDARGGPGYPSNAPPRDGAPVNVDVGNYDGSHYLNSGKPAGAMYYSVTFTNPGTYRYACTIHPRMIGTVIVSG